MLRREEFMDILRKIQSADEAQEKSAEDEM